MEEIRISLYKRDQYYAAPTTPGIYAWLLYAPIGKRAALNPIELASDLEEYERMANQQLVELRSPGEFFKSKWQATFSLDSKEWDVEDMFPAQPEITGAAVDHFNQVLSALTPVLYVGKADNLRSRIENHVKALEKIDQWEYLNLDQEGRFFAERAHQMLIPLDLLRFTFFEFPKIECEEDLILKTNEKVEGFINRILKPSLGRR
jgi:hypothetical protein